MGDGLRERGEWGWFLFGFLIWCGGGGGTLFDIGSFVLCTECCLAVAGRHLDRISDVI